jgi:ABC-type multidrug transport system permease subunit
MRASVAIVLATVMLAVGFQAMSLQSQDVAPDINNSTNTTTDVYNATNDVYTGLAITFSTVLPWMGFAAIILLAGGFLVTSGGAAR